MLIQIVAFSNKIFKKCLLLDFGSPHNKYSKPNGNSDVIVLERITEKIFFSLKIYLLEKKIEMFKLEMKCLGQNKLFSKYRLNTGLGLITNNVKYENTDILGE